MTEADSFLTAAATLVCASIATDMDRPVCLPDAASDHYHWHIEFVPKLTRTGGFEWGTGFYINPTPPEEAAKFLRAASVEEPTTTSVG